jgi:hypothetical protein
MLTLNNDNEFVFSTYNYKFNAGSDRIDLYKGIDNEDNLGDWCWVYFGYNRESRTAVAYIRYRDREISEFFYDVHHFIPKYFGLETGN